MTTELTSSLPAADPSPPASSRRRSWLRGLIRGRESDARWVRPALLLLLAGTAVLYVWGLGASGWANSYYSAAVQAGAESWKAFFFGSSDAANAITVDKAPLALWPMVISARLFGLSSWSILVPQAVEGILSVGLLYALVRRWSGPVAGLISAGVLALTPVAVLMFRYNNPDALLVLLLVAGAYACVRAVESGRTGWLVLAGSCVGFGFLAKMLQALLVVPAFALVYLIAGPHSAWRRLWQLVLAGAAMVVSAGWYVAVVQLWPAADRPYVGGSQNNSILELTLGYNGIGRITGGEFGGLGNTNQEAGIGRLFGAEMGGQISWLLPAALLFLVALFWVSAKAPRTDRTRAAAVLWGTWLLVTGLVLSFSQGIIHGYYTVALAPAIAALVGIGVVTFWRRRRELDARLILAVAVAVTAAWSFQLLGQAGDWQPWLRYAVLAAGIAATVALAVSHRLMRWMVAVAAAVAIFAVLGGAAGYAVQTAASTHKGALPAAGPDGFGGARVIAGTPPPGMTANKGGPRLFTAPPPGATTGGPATGKPRGAVRIGGAGLLDAATAPAAVTALLKQNAGSYTWVAAAVRSNSAAGYQLATGLPVMAIGGFNGTDPAPTLAQFQKYVAEGKIHYFIGDRNESGMPRGNGVGGGSTAAQQIATWVAKNFKAKTVGGVTVYDLSS